MSSASASRHSTRAGSNWAPARSRPAAGPRRSLAPGGPPRCTRPARPAWPRWGRRHRPPSRATPCRPTARRRPRGRRTPSPPARARSPAPGQGGVAHDHAVEVVAPVEGELHAGPHPLQRRVPSPDAADHGHHLPEAWCARSSYLRRLQLDVVTEPLRLLVGVGVAAHADQQRRVVDAGAIAIVETDPLGQAAGDQALPQHVLHRLAEAEVDAERQRGDELSEADRRQLLHLLGAHAEDAIPRLPCGQRLAGEIHTGRCSRTG